MRGSTGADIGEHRVPLLGGAPYLDAAGKEKFETRGYQAQVAADPNSMPPSTFTATPKNVSEVNGPYIGGIMKDDNGVEPLYPAVNAVYKGKYQKK